MPRIEPVIRTWPSTMQPFEENSLGCCSAFRCFRPIRLSSSSSSSSSLSLSHSNGSHRDSSITMHTVLRAEPANRTCHRASPTLRNIFLRAICQGIIVSQTDTFRPGRIMRSELTIVCYGCRYLTLELSYVSTLHRAISSLLSLSCHRA
jgi:hypothetical protein